MLENVPRGAGSVIHLCNFLPSPEYTLHCVYVERLMCVYVERLMTYKELLSYPHLLGLLNA